jgi:hypothetical protein
VDKRVKGMGYHNAPKIIFVVFNNAMLSFQHHRCNRQPTMQVARWCLDMSVFFILYDFLQLYRIKDAAVHYFNAGSYLLTISQPRNLCN